MKQPTLRERGGVSSPAWLEAGRGNPVLFLHGIGGTARAWTPQLRALAGESRCLAWDLPGYGRSPLHTLGSPTMTFDTIVAAIDRLLDEAGVGAVSIVGLSFGGQQALHYVLANRDRVDRLVLADTSAVFGADGTDPEVWKRRRLDPLDRGLTPADIAAPIIDAITGPEFSGPLRRLMLDSFADITSDGLRAAVGCLPDHDVSDRLGLIDTETLVIVGELDRETPVAYSRALVDAMPNAELAVMAGVGHLTPAEDPVGFNRLISRFLARP